MTDSNLLLNMMDREIFGLSRSRDHKGVIVKRSLVPYTNCIHTMVGGGWKTMEVLVVEIYEEEDY